MTEPLPGTCVVELGAGKGGLSHRLVERSPIYRNNCIFYLIDRKNSRRKHDAKLKTVLNDRTVRIFQDIRDLDFSLLLPASTTAVLFMAKHLCGEATCLSLYAIDRLRKARPNINIYLTIVPCCHQLCAGHFLNQPATINKQRARRLGQMSSWYVCENRLPSSETMGGVHDARQLGYRCKLYIDTCRLRFLRQIPDMIVHYTEYCPKFLTPENRLIIASPPR